MKKILTLIILVFSLSRLDAQILEKYRCGVGDCQMPAFQGNDICFGNIFTPNGDGMNDVFEPLPSCAWKASTYQITRDEADDDYVDGFAIINDELIVARHYSNRDNDFQNFVQTYNNSQRQLFTQSTNDNNPNIWCLPINGSTSSIKFVVYASRNDNSWIGFNDFRKPVFKSLQVWDVTEDDAASVAFSSPNEILVQPENTTSTIGGTNDHWFEYEWEGYLKPGHKYFFRFLYNFESRNVSTGLLDKILQGNQTYFICVEDVNPLIDTDVEQVGCSEKVRINNYSNQLTYFASKSSNFNNPVEFNLENGEMSANLSEGDWYIKGIMYNDVGSVLYETSVITKEVLSTDIPDAPVFLGKNSYCMCSDGDNPILEFQYGGPGFSLLWYDENGGEIAAQNGMSSIDFYDFSNSFSENISVAAINNETGCISDPTVLDEVELIDCDCEKKFAPTASKKYVLSGWVKEGNNINGPYLGPSINLIFSINNSITGQVFRPSGKIIDGWQQIRAEVTIPANATKMEIELKNNGSNNKVWFDDIRFQPFNSSMVSYVYNPETYQLVAELDDENFKTEYIYDKDGNLIKTNVESTDGVRTVSESRSHVKITQ